MNKYYVTYDLITRLFGQLDKKLRLKREVIADNEEEAKAHVERAVTRDGYAVNIIRCTEA